MAAFRAEPPVIGSGRPFASRTANERTSVTLPAFCILSDLRNRDGGHKAIIGEAAHRANALKQASDDHRTSQVVRLDQNDSSSDKARDDDLI